MPHPCELCHVEIPRERLAAIPDTRLCVKCSDEVGGEWEYVGVGLNLAKTGSRKTNYGGLAIYKIRRQIR